MTTYIRYLLFDNLTCCGYLLKWPQQDNSNSYQQHTVLRSIARKNKNIFNTPCCLQQQLGSLLLIQQPAKNWIRLSRHAGWLEFSVGLCGGEGGCFLSITSAKWCNSVMVFLNFLPKQLLRVFVRKVLMSQF